MLIPFGDDVERTRVPKGVISLIVVHVIVAAYQLRLAQDFGTHPRYLNDFMLGFGLIPTELASGSVVGVVTYMFLHGGFMYLFGNMVVLWAFGPTLEEFPGTKRFLLMYFVTGIAAGLTHAALSWGAEIPLVGASGAIAGVIGVYGISVGPDTRIKTWVFLFFKSMVIRVPTVVYAMFWMYSQWSGFMSTSSNSNSGGVAFGCHIGGFFGGMLLYPFIKTNTRRLVDHGFGIKQIHDDEEEMQAELAILETAKVTAITQKCSDCHSELLDEHVIAPDLYRCPQCSSTRFHPGTVLPEPTGDY